MFFFVVFTVQFLHNANRIWLCFSIRKGLEKKHQLLRTFPQSRCFLPFPDPFHCFRIDFLSLDIEGLEQAVLESVPWDKVDIQTILVEVSLNVVFYIIKKVVLYISKIVIFLDFCKTKHFVFYNHYNFVLL